MKISFSKQVLFALLLAVLLSACGRHTKFAAPEIDPPADLIPGYVPEGYKLVSGFKVENSITEGLFTVIGAQERVSCNPTLGDAFFNLKSPAGNDLLGVYYEKDDQLLLISKSYFPGGSLDLWQTTFEAAHEEGCACDCGCLEIAIDIPIPVRAADLEEVRPIGDTEAAILENPFGWIIVFVRGEYLITVESEMSLEENLKIVESLLR